MSSGPEEPESHKPIPRQRGGWVLSANGLAEEAALANSDKAAPAPNSELREDVSGLGAWYALKGLAFLALFGGVVVPLSVSASQDEYNRSKLAASLPPAVSADGFTLDHVIPADELNESTEDAPAYGNKNTHIVMKVGKNCVLNDVSIHYEGTPGHISDVSQYSVTTYPNGHFGTYNSPTLHHGVPAVKGVPRVTTFTSADDLAKQLQGETCQDFANQVSLASISEHVSD